MADKSIHVARNISGDWEVRGKDLRSMHSFRLREEAVAFGRAVAFTGGRALFLHDTGGPSLRQTRASMTYPSVLA